MTTARQALIWILAPLIALMGLISKMYEQHKFARRFTLHWSQALITYCVWKFWQNLNALHDQHMMYLGGITALLTISIGLYQWDAAREGK